MGKMMVRRRRGVVTWKLSTFCVVVYDSRQSITFLDEAEDR
jgi:hypothetical protein